MRDIQLYSASDNGVGERLARVYRVILSDQLPSDEAPGGSQLISKPEGKAVANAAG